MATITIEIDHTKNTANTNAAIYKTALEEKLTVPQAILFLLRKAYKPQGN